MFWTPEELGQLQASAVVGRVGRAEADEMILGRIVPVVRAHGDVFLAQGSGKSVSDEEIVSLAHRLGSAIMAYAFDLERDDDDDDDDEEDAEDGWVEDRAAARAGSAAVLGMVPMADILNADAQFNAHISHETDALVATSLRDISAGEEVLNYYGPLSNGELLRRYGYVTEAHQRWDVVELPWSLVEARLKEEIGVSEEAWVAVVSHSLCRSVGS
jgi:SET domain-containing protein 6